MDSPGNFFNFFIILSFFIFYIDIQRKIFILGVCFLVWSLFLKTFFWFGWKRHWWVSLSIMAERRSLSQSDLLDNCVDWLFFSSPSILGNLWVFFVFSFKEIDEYSSIYAFRISPQMSNSKSIHLSRLFDFIYKLMVNCPCPCDPRFSAIYGVFFFFF